MSFSFRDCFAALTCGSELRLRMTGAGEILRFTQNDGGKRNDEGKEEYYWWHPELLTNNHCNVMVGYQK